MPRIRTVSRIGAGGCALAWDRMDASMPQPAQPPAISVVVPAHNAEATLGATLRALCAQTGDFEVIVVDSASSDQTAAVAAAVASGDGRVRVLSNPGGEPASSRNVGVRAAGAPLIAFTDADCVPQPGWLAAGMSALRTADLVQGRVLPAGPHRVWDRTLSVGHESGLYETANLFIRREIAELAGGFRSLPGFREMRPFGEDTWFAWRARRAGARTAFCADAVVHHAVVHRSVGGYVGEQRRRGHFPALVRAVPELRGAFLYRRWFLSRQTAAFDLALAGAAGAVLARRRLGLLATIPYLLTLPLPRRPVAAVVQIGADAVGAAALARGSLAARTLVL
jgi:glycosyltransferase involved in cell wall biosynthesis